MSNFAARVVLMMRRRVAIRTAVLLLTGCLVALVVTTCISSPAHLMSPGGGGNGVSVTHSEPNKPYTFGGLVVCLDRPGRVTIDKLVPVQATGGLRIDDWVAVPNPFITGATQPFLSADGSIAQLGASITDPRINLSASTRSVDHKCSANPERPDAATAPIWFYVQFSKPTDATAADTAIEIRYTSGGQHMVFRTRWFEALCGPDRRADLCQS